MIFYLDLECSWAGDGTEEEILKQGGGARNTERTKIRPMEKGSAADVVGL